MAPLPTPPKRPPFDDDTPIAFTLKYILGRIYRYIVIIVLIVAVIFFSQGIILVKQGETAILIKKTGLDLSNYNIEKDEYRYLLSCPNIAPNAKYKGIQEQTLGEGWHFYNPYTWDYEIIQQTNISSGEVGVLLRLFGKRLDTEKYQILASKDIGGNLEDCQMGIVREVLTPGRYLINTYAYQVLKYPAVVVPQGHRGVVTNLAASVSTRGDFCMGDFKNVEDLVQKLVEGKKPGHKYFFDLMDENIKIMLRQRKASDLVSQSERELLLKQINRLISIGKCLYKEDIFPSEETASDIKLLLNQKTLTSSEILQLNHWLLADAFPHEIERSSFLVNNEDRGVCYDTLAPGTYYYNPFEKLVVPIDIRSHRFDLKGEENQVLFPSFDGFIITMEGNIEWHIDPNRVADVFVKYKDDRDIVKCIEEKIILPNARAFIRIEGSKYMARDYISGLTREKFQNTFYDNLFISCKHEGIVIKAARVTKCTPPDEICQPIQQREIAIRDREKYDQEMEREKEQIKLQTEAARRDFEVRSTRAQTTVEVNKTNAQREKEVALIGMLRKVEVARKRLEASKNEAQAIILSAQAKADVIRMQNKAAASGIADARGAFRTGRNYANYLLMKKVATSLDYILANSDSPFLNIFRELDHQVQNNQTVSMPEQKTVPPPETEQK